MPENNHRVVLMADDDPEDCALATEAFGKSGAKADFVCVSDGMKLMDYLAKHSRPETRGLPALILLDLSMPLKNGLEALIEIKSDPALQHISVVILTTSEEDMEADVTTRAGAESFITKPATFNEWVLMMKTLAERWLR